MHTTKRYKRAHRVLNLKVRVWHEERYLKMLDFFKKRENPPVSKRNTQRLVSFHIYLLPIYIYIYIYIYMKAKDSSFMLATSFVNSPEVTTDLNASLCWFEMQYETHR